MTQARRATVAVRMCAVAVLGVLAGGVALTASVVTAPPAEATTYRYWTYWSGERPGATASWKFAARGPAGDVISDGTVLGWRFAVTSQAGSDAPRQSAALATLCPSLASPASGRIRVALVVDYGTQADAPPGQKPPLSGSVRVECLTFPSGPRVTGVTVLDQAGIPVRSENGLVCALDAYPTGECAPVVSSAPRPSASPSRTPSRSASPRPSSSSSSRPTPSTTASSGGARSSSPTPGTSSSSSSTSATPSAAAVASSSSPTPSSSSSSAGASAEETLPAVSGSPATPDASSPGAGSFVGGALVVAGVAGAAWWTSRRRGVS